jgi:L-alanine-DL-glutamate epimerase-like enolase superfamily enzyme
VPIYELLGGKVRDKCRVYCWIGGDRPQDIEVAAYVSFLTTLNATQNAALTILIEKHGGNKD